MNLQNDTIEDWLKEPPGDCLKRGGDTTPFYSKYDTFKEYLDKNLHNEVTKQAIFHEYLQDKNRDEIIFLNDHGPNHIKTVIQRASELLCHECKLNAREVFLVLNAIQVHDIGNFYGRIGHESRVLDAIKEGLTPIVFDTTEVRYINQIAQAHGGTITYKNGDKSKNTIAKIKPTVESDGYTIRIQLLAAILRFADELADDKNRADHKALKENRLPLGSQIYHAYAQCLDTVKVIHEKQTIELHFKVPEHYLTRTFGKVGEAGVTQEYLIDEIYKRSIKMHHELIYCSKFWKKHIDIERIWVQIEFYKELDENSHTEEDLNVHSEITYTLHDNDYPNSSNDIFQHCPTLKYHDGKLINGENLHNYLKERDAESI